MNERTNGARHGVTRVTSARRCDINLITGSFMLEGADPAGPSQTITLRESMKIIPRRTKRTVCIRACLSGALLRPAYYRKRIRHTDESEDSRSPRLTCSEFHRAVSRAGCTPYYFIGYSWLRSPRVNSQRRIEIVNPNLICDKLNRRPSERDCLQNFLAHERERERETHGVAYR